ncbi:MAG: hypothetical protein U1F35_23130 [Steroidobacteraceae bacterium]
MRPVTFSLDHAPSPGVTMPFLAAGPCFLVAAGIVLAVQGSTALESRWSPGALALTHLLTVGFMLQTMCGALLQFTPVVAGARIWRPAWSARLSQVPMLAGGVLLPCALGAGAFHLLLPAAVLLATGIGLFLLILLAGLGGSRAGLRTGGTLWLALMGLAVTAVLGTWLVLSLRGKAALPLLPFTDLHASWGLGGWSLVLLMSVAGVAVPMLQLTARFPRWLLAACAGAVSAALLAWTLACIAAGPALAGTLAMSLVLAAAGVFAIMLLWLMLRSRRPAKDASALYLRLAMVSILLLGAGSIALPMLPASLGPATQVALGVLTLVGVFVAAISGMLYKIVPFMLWLRLSRLHGPRRTPGTASIIPQSSARGQFMLFGVAMPALLAAPFVPALARPAGVLFAASSAWLAFNVGRAIWVHRRAFRPAPPVQRPEASEHGHR